VSVKITLNEGETAVASVSAILRYTVNRASGVVDRKGGPQSCWKTDLNGVGAEMAFAKYKNLYPDFSTNPRQGGSDFTLINGDEVDIKCTQYKTGKLIVNKDKNTSKTKYYILVIGEVPAFEIVGYATADEVFKNENLKEIYGRECYQIEQCNLHQIQE
jgi:hypothetical protein